LSFFWGFRTAGITINAKGGTRIYLPLSNPEAYFGNHLFHFFVSHTDSTNIDSLKTRLKRKKIYLV
jgi:hypothetical protein